MACMALSWILPTVVNYLDRVTLRSAVGVYDDTPTSRFIFKGSNPEEERRHNPPARDPPIRHLNNGILLFRVGACGPCKFTGCTGW